MKRKDSKAPASARKRAGARPDDGASMESARIGLWSERGIPHTEICARLHERSDLECFLAIRLLDGPANTAFAGAPDQPSDSSVQTGTGLWDTPAHETGASASNQLISRLAARLLDTQKILRLLEPHIKRPATSPAYVDTFLEAEDAGVPVPPDSPPDKNSTLPALLELNALAVEGWVRVTKAARAELN